MPPGQADTAALNDEDEHDPASTNLQPLPATPATGIERSYTPKDWTFTEDVRVYIVAGDDFRAFRVHKDVLCSTSSFLKSKLANQPWSEYSSICLSVGRNWLEPFLTYVRWLYLRKFLLDHDEEACTSTWHPARTFVEHMLFACTLGVVLEDTAYRDAVADEMLRVCVAHNVHPHLDLVRRSWHLLPSNCGLRQVIIEVLAHHIRVIDFEAEIDTLPDGLVRGMARVLALEQNEPERYRLPGDRDPGYYHEHVQEPENHM